MAIKPGARWIPGRPRIKPGVARNDGPSGVIPNGRHDCKAHAFVIPSEWHDRKTHAFVIPGERRSRETRDPQTGSDGHAAPEFTQWIPARTLPRVRNDSGVRERGVTLVELVVVMTLLGIIAAVAAVALRDPVRAYADSNRRAELTDMADTALRRMARDIRLALPNSVRVSGTNLELLLTKTGGRYREQQNGAGQGNVLDFALPDTQFDTLGTMSNIPAPIANGDILGVYNLYADPGITSANAYTFGSGNCSAADSPNCNTTAISGTSAGALPNETRIRFAARQFPHASPGNRFHVVQGPVTYECAPGPRDAQGNATGTLKRISGYTIALNQPTGAGFGTSALLAGNVAGCDITYNPLVLTQSLGLVSISLTLTRGGESVRLYHEVHVTNIP
jgi:MSHA biogenesis protein MshO